MSPEVLNAGYLGVFVFLLVAASLRMVYRLQLYRTAKRRPDVILVRDLFLFSTLMVVFGAILVARAFDVSGLSRNVPWIIATSTPVIAAMAFWVWVEYRVIDRRGKP